MARAMTLMSANVLYSAAPVSGPSGIENDDGSITYNDNVTVNKTIEKTSVDNVYKLDMTAESESKIVTTTTGVDFVLMLDLSSYMSKYTVTDYSPLNKSNETLYDYFNANNLYYSTSGEAGNAQKVVNIDVQRKGYVWDRYNSYTYTFADGSRKTSDRDSSIPNFGGQFFAQTKTETSSDERLEALKAAVTTFVNDVATKSPGSRVAIVTYSNDAAVLTGSGRADGGALVTMDNNGKEALLQITNNLTVKGGDSNSDYALADAVKIFQDENDNFATDGAGQVYAQRQRVAVLFSAGTAGNGKFKDGDSGYPNYDQIYSGNGTGNEVAQGSMHLAAILKTPRNENANVTDYGSQNDTDIIWTENFYGEGDFGENGG